LRPNCPYSTLVLARVKSLQTMDFFALSWSIGLVVSTRPRLCY
jgi:hypothetical protein